MACGVLTTRGVLKDENGLILPRKVANPCLESSTVREVQREIRWNSNKGINVLNTKSELEKVLAKQRKASEQNIQEVEEKVEDEFKKMVAERAKRLQKLEQEESLPIPPPTQPSMRKSQAVTGGEKMQKTTKKSSVISEADKSVIEQESEFARVFAQLRGAKRELVC